MNSRSTQGVLLGVFLLSLVFTGAGLADTGAMVPMRSS